MNFAHTEDQLDLRDGAREYLRGSCTSEYLRSVIDSGTAKQTSLHFWPELASQGLLGFLAPESLGGLGLDAIGFSLLAEEAGYVALPDPLSNSAGISVSLLSTLGAETTCEALISAEQKVLVLHALNPFVNHANDADKFLLVGENEIRLIDASEATLKKVDSIDPLRMLYSVEVEASAGEKLSHGEQAASLNELTIDLGALFSAAELLGLSAAMIDMATAYAKDRQQFGKPIGSYQAVKHHLATALVALEFAKPVVYRASADVAHCRPNCSRSVSHAKIAATDAAIQAAEIAIQVHGGMGYTFEVDLHVWMKRAWALAGSWGDRNYHQKQINAALFERGQKVGPAETF